MSTSPPYHVTYKSKAIMKLSFFCETESKKEKQKNDSYASVEQLLSSNSLRDTILGNV